MKILLIHHNTNNTGDDAIVESTIDQMREIFPDSEIVLESSNPEVSKKQFSDIKVVERLFSIRGINHTGKTLSLAFAIKNIPFLIKTAHKTLVSLCYLYFPTFTKKYEILNEYKEADLVLSVAGDSISQDYAWFFRFYELWYLHKFKKTVILYAQSVGPFDGISQKLAKKYLSLSTAIFARDRHTIDLLNKYGVKTQIIKTADVAIALKSVSNNVALKEIKRHSLDTKVVGIVIRTPKYANIEKDMYERYINGMIDLVLFIQESGYRTVFIATIPEDSEAADNFMKNNNLDCPLLKLYEIRASEAKSILATLGAVVSPRMHPIILSSSMNVPILGIGKEFKMYDYLKLVGTDEYFIKMVPFDSKNAIEKIDSILKNRNSISDKIASKLTIARNMSNLNATYAQEVYNHHQLIMQKEKAHSKTL